MGPYLIFGVLEATGVQNLTLMYSKRFIEKSMIPKEKIITFYDPIPCKWDDIEENQPGLVIQSLNHLTSINLLKYNKIVKEPSKYKIEDIRHLNGVGFIIAKRGSKNIFHIPVPVKIDDRSSYVNLYQSEESIRSIDFNFENDTPYLYVSDSDEYLKKFDMPRRDSTSLKMVNEYFVYVGFSGREVYRINNGLLFVKNIATKLTEKYLHMKNPNHQIEQYHPS